MGPHPGMISEGSCVVRICNDKTSSLPKSYEVIWADLRFYFNCKFKPILSASIPLQIVKELCYVISLSSLKKRKSLRLRLIFFLFLLNFIYLFNFPKIYDSQDDLQILKKAAN